MTPAARSFIQSQASDVAHALQLYFIQGVAPEEMIVLLLDNGSRIGAPPRPFVFMLPRNALEVMASGDQVWFEVGDEPSAPRATLGRLPSSPTCVRAVKLLVEEAGHFLRHAVPEGRALTIAKIGDELVEALFRPPGTPSTPAQRH